MRRFLVVLLMILMFAGCCAATGEMDRAISLRNRLLQSNGCSFDAVITADYGSKIYTFSMACQMDKNGVLSFSVKEPETISGISGEISEEGGKLKFTDTVLALETMTEGQLTPVAAPWIVMKTLRSGYISTCGADNDGLRIQICDSYEADALALDIWLDGADVPIRGEILWKGRRILSVDIRNFCFL